MQKTRIVAVVSNNSDANVLATARAVGIPSFHLSGKTHPDSDRLDGAIVSALDSVQANLVLLLGYLKLLGPQTLNRYQGRILNIHPSLLPRHGGSGMFGLRVQQSVLDARDAEAGATLHLVDEIYDHGAIVMQGRVPVALEESAETLAHKIVGCEREMLITFLSELERDVRSLPLA